MDLDSESKLVSLLIQLVSPRNYVLGQRCLNPKFIFKVISLLRSMDWDLQPKPKSKFMSLTSQIISLFSTMDLDSQPKPLLELISLFLQETPVDNNCRARRNCRDHVSLMPHEQQLPGPSHLPQQPHLPGPPRLPRREFMLRFASNLRQVLDLGWESEPKLISLIHQILSMVLSMSSVKEKLVSLYPQACVTLEEGKFHVVQNIFHLRSKNKWECFPLNWMKYNLKGEEDVTYFHCLNCNGRNHKEYKKAPLMIKHVLHRKHSLQLVVCKGITRKCYCCDIYLEICYYCQACDIAINFACANKQPVLSVDHPKWHEHRLALFPRTSLTCDVCGLTHSSCPFYTCPPCNFVIHQSCFQLPRVIRISRHLHRIAFTPSFDLGNWYCGICRTKIDNDYGGYCCIKKGCLYGAHSKCATQSNVWDGEELEGKPEEIEEEIEPFFKISDGIIQHFLHQHHHLRLDENTCRDYDENRQCHACVTPIYFGNFYSCMQCDFILHEGCANLSRKIYHPIHQHMLTLGGYDGILDYHKDRCSACPRVCKTGFFYKCTKERCHFQLQVQCAMISEPLEHESHLHPLYLTSKPGEEKRRCSICIQSRETFNCIECDFSLCFSCAILPHKVRYKHDKHTLTLSYGNETSTMTYWCEVCEKKINPKKQFYMCDEYCCVTLHIQCILGSDLYMKPGSIWNYKAKEIGVLPNNRMSRPICSYCAKRCPDKIVFQCFGSICCSMNCATLILIFPERKKH